MSYNIEQVNSGFMALSSGAFSAGTNAGTFQNTATITYTSNGIFASKAATNNVALSAGHAAIPPGRSAVFALWLNASGTYFSSMGATVEAGELAPVPVAPGNNLTLVGLVKVTTSSATTFTPGTTAFGAAGVTSTFFNVMLPPGTSV